MHTETSYDAEAHLNFQDVSVEKQEDPQVLQVRIKASKTDPLQAGMDIFVGKMNCRLCPVAAVLAYMTKRGPQSGPLFRFSDGRPLTRLWFVKEVKEALTRAGMDSSCY